MERLKVTFFGRPCRFSAQVISTLLDRGYQVDLIVLPGRSISGARIVQQPAAKPRLSLTPVDHSVAVLPTVSSLAWSAGAKVAEVSRDQLESIPRRFHELSKGVVVSACYPWRLPDTVLETPPAGAINVHPSLLPAHRGPDPVFWTLHAGDRVAGSTVHQMTGQLDGGPILAQRPMAVPLRIRYDELEQQLVKLGALLLSDTLDRMVAGGSTAIDQPDSDASFQDFPDKEAMQLDTSWPAERAFRFVYGVAPVYGPAAILLPDGETRIVDDALTLRTSRQSHPAESDGAGRVAVRFSDGVVVFHESASQRIG